MIMWYAEFTRKELVELCLGGGYDSRNVRVEKSGRVVVAPGSTTYHAYWREDPEKAPGIPTLIVTPDGEAQDFLTALNASPQAPSPFTALCRVLSMEEARVRFNEPLREVDEISLRATAILSMAEAILHSDGKFTLKTLGPAACRRTVAFAWGRAYATGAPASSFEPLVGRWLETYALMGHSEGSFAWVAATITSALQVLQCTLPREEWPPSNLGRGFSLINGVLDNDDREIDAAWSVLARELALNVSLREIAAASREDRGGYLQQALRMVAASKESSAALGCAFLATQVAPRSLEHLEILRAAGRPQLVLWYSFMATIQNPLAILSEYGGLGFRVLRDIKSIDQQFSNPSADISHQELKTISRVGMENIGRRAGHVGEVEVELAPLVSATFSLPSRPPRTETATKVERDSRAQVGLSDARRARIYDALNAIAKTIEEPSEEFVLTSPQASTRRAYRKK